MEVRSLIDVLGLQLLPGGFCLWGPTLLASDLMLGANNSKNGPSDQQLLRCLSQTARETKASRIVLLGSLFSPKADADGDLPGLLVPWRSELLEVEIAWVYSKAAPQWDQILDFLEISRVASGAKLGEAELLSTKSLPTSSVRLAFVGGASPYSLDSDGRKTAAWLARGQLLAFPACSIKAAKKTIAEPTDWIELAKPVQQPPLMGEPSDEADVKTVEAAI